MGRSTFCPLSRFLTEAKKELVLKAWGPRSHIWGNTWFNWAPPWSQTGGLPGGYLPSFSKGMPALSCCPRLFLGSCFLFLGHSGQNGYQGHPHLSWCF